MRSATVAFVLFASIAAIGGVPGDRQSAAASQPGAPKLDRTHKGAAAPTAAFVDHAGKPVRIADFKGRPVLVNLWATWCAPCIAEMPALDRLAKRGGAKLAVLPVSQDLAGWHGVDKFFTPAKFPALTPYLDRENALALKLGAAGLPVSVLYDAQGREVWRVAGPVEWDKMDAAAL